jgi:small conductance mechanosensitive channel
MILFMPDISALRMFALSDESARYGMRWWRRFVLIGVVSYFAVELADLLEVPGSLVTLFTQAVGLCMVIMALVVIFQNRARMAHKLLHRAKRPTAGVHGLRRRFAETWHVFAAVYVMGLYAVWALGLPGGFSFLMRASIVTLIVFAFTRIVAELVSRAIAGSLAASAHLGARLPGLESRLGRYLPLLLRVAQVVVYALAITVLAEAWGLQPFRVLASATGQHIANALASIAVVLIVAAISWEALNIFIDHYLSTQASQGRHRRQRMQTLLPLLRNITRLSLSVLVGLIILSQLGIDIAPLLAGAGVIGLAVGFGAQSLVKDVITGVFLVAEDTIAVGDLVNIDSHEGRVEAMTVRSVSIRDDEGALHTLPYSLIESIKNMSKDYAVAILEIPFNRSVHYEDAAALMEEIGQELKSGEAGKIILSDLNLSGVSKISDNAMTVRATMRVAPGARRRITRAFNLLLKRKLESAGLELAKS